MSVTAIAGRLAGLSRMELLPYEACRQLQTLLLTFSLLNACCLLAKTGTRSSRPVNGVSCHSQHFGSAPNSMLAAKRGSAVIALEG